MKNLVTIYIVTYFAGTMFDDGYMREIYIDTFSNIVSAKELVTKANRLMNAEVYYDGDKIPFNEPVKYFKIIKKILEI